MSQLNAKYNSTVNSIMFSVHLYSIVASSLLSLLLVAQIVGVISFNTPYSGYNKILKSRKTSVTTATHQWASQSQGDIQSAKTSSDDFIKDFFSTSSSSSSISECDDTNLPPSLNIIAKSIHQLASKGASSDIRGRFVNHPHRGHPSAIAKVILEQQETQKQGGGSSLPILTPLAAHCLGYAFATLLKTSMAHGDHFDDQEPIKILLGRDPRSHGIVLADSFSRGAESVKGVQVTYTGLATTPSMASFCRSNLCHGAVMVTASHLPKDRNGFKFFSSAGSNFEPQEKIHEMIDLAEHRVSHWYDLATIPPTSGPDAVYCSGGWIDHMGHYKQALKQALVREVTGIKEYDENHNHSNLLTGIRVVLNSGNGSGGFFASVLEELGADVSGSIHIPPNGEFPNGVPNPENQSMIHDTIHACEAALADVGILLDTDADRCGLVVPSVSSAASSVPQYEAIHRNKLIALMGVIFAHDSPGCAIVTCSVTSEGLAKFLTQDLGLLHVRYLKGYANVIQKAKTLTESGQANAQVAIETSGHCAMKENDYLDDGTYTAVKVIGLLAREKVKDPSFLLPSLIEDLKEMGEIVEIRMAPSDGTMESMERVFDHAAKLIEEGCRAISGWSLDTENLEGIRVTVGDDGSFFMLRKSLHDPVLSLQIEAASKLDSTRNIVYPILSIFEPGLLENGVMQLGLESHSLREYAEQAMA